MHKKIIIVVNLNISYFNGIQLHNQVLEQMKLLYHSIFLEHNTGHHPENKDRLDAFKGLPSSPLHLDESILTKVHKTPYIEKVKRCSELSLPLDSDTITSPKSFEAALSGAQLTLQAAQNGDFALVRPPGHHAYANKGSGFCLFNNIAIATQHLVEEGLRVLILDFDGHLGDGTSDIFYHTNKVMYMSLHQYPAFPGHGFIYEMGDGPGKGYTINIPLPAGSGDDILEHALDHFLTIGEQFKPDVLALSAGFDSHQHEFLLNLKFSLNSFYNLGKRFAQTFPRIFATLEGGYNLNYLPKCILNFVAGINGEPMPFAEEVTQSGLRAWEVYEANANAGLSLLKQYWKI